VVCICFFRCSNCGGNVQTDRMVPFGRFPFLYLCDSCYEGQQAGRVMTKLYREREKLQLSLNQSRVYEG
jgi:hypothetical protein